MAVITDWMTSHRRQEAWRLAAASIVGVLTGVVALLLEHAVEDVVHEIVEAPAWVPVATLATGVVLTAVITRYLAGRATATTERYVSEFHQEEPQVEPRHAPGRLLASFTTLGSGAPLGMEGPAVYTGTVAASLIYRWQPRAVAAGYHVLLVAGAAAGIAAVFKAPAAGAIFALEVPFRKRLGSERVLPAIFGAATGYLTMAAINGVKPELEIPLITLSLRQVVLSALLGLAVGIAAIGVIALIEFAEDSHQRWSVPVRAAVAAVGLPVIYLIGRALTDEPIAIASGNSVIEWAIEPGRAGWLLLAVFLLRALGPAVAIGGGGVGGLFIPLMAAGALIGRIFANASSQDDVALFVVVGAACMLGGGYAVPLTGVVFVAEYTGQAAVIVPGLVAMAATQMVIGLRSVSPEQVS